MLVPPARVLAIIVCSCIALAGCGTAEPTLAVVEPQATIQPTFTPAPTPLPVLLPTPTPQPTPTVDPAIAFDEWLAANGYTFIVDVNDGSRRYMQRENENSIVVDVYPDGVLAHQLIIESRQFSPSLHEIVKVTIAVMEAHGIDVSSFREALAAPHQLPMLMQGDDYVVVLEQDRSLLRSRITFFGD